MALVNRMPTVTLVCTYALAGLLLAGLLLARVAPPPGGASRSPVARATATPSPTPTPTATATAAPTATPAVTPTASATPTPRATPLPVRVLRTCPIDGDTDLPPGAPLCIVFDQAMDTAAGAVSVAITPSLPLEIEWPAPDSLLIRTGPRQDGIAYRLTLEAAPGAGGGALVRPLSLTFGQGGQGAPIPILMYHHVDTLADGAPAGLREWAVGPEEFVAHLDLLADLGAQVVPLADAVAYLERGEPLPERPVVITFDDGNKPVLETAVPILQARGLPATFFVPAQYADVDSKYFMNWDDLRALADAGFALGGHGYQHGYVQALSPEEAERQLGAERRRIAEMTGQEPDFFAYPFGQYSPRTIEQLKSYGYRAALTIEQAVYQRPSLLFELGRIRVGYGEPLDSLRRKLPWGKE